ncbi:hypothetical protein GA0070607_0975 [Micromonospora coriariae]|uniref:Uncharacterized protein n=1 Tax=Micromonospora coriariae TaxID=285665 RepID=A0A1C4UQ95_9ACTN|nr:hypothetical protein [Micromonospora coriariae]SCE73827.1 hypothetical protein GA0070607_0975 [Micromonospora coriariae]
MSQPPTGPDGLPPATPTPQSSATDQTASYAAGPPAGPSNSDPTVPHPTVPHPTVPHPTGAEPTVQYTPGQPAPQQQYTPGQPAPQQQYAPGQATPQYAAAAPPVPPQYGVPQVPPGYPASAPPYAGQVSAPPVSGPGYGQPMSAPPGMAPPYGPPMAPVSGRGRAVLVLALVAALLFVVSGVMTGLFVTRSNELNRTEKRLTGQVGQRDDTIAANSTEISKLKTDLQTMQEKLDNTEQDLTGTRNDRDEQARQKKIIASCLDKLTTALGAAAAGNKSAYDAAMKGLDKVCDEADNYL